MKRDEIINELAKGRVVERIVMNIGHSGITADLSDLTQEIYLILLAYDELKLIEIWESGNIEKFVGKITVKQFRSKTSPFHIVYRKFREHSADITGMDFIDERDR